MSATEISGNHPQPLKCCPFCGSTVAPRIASSVELEKIDGRPARYQVLCDPFVDGCAASTDYFPTQDEARTAWSRRSYVEDCGCGPRECKAIPAMIGRRCVLSGFVVQDDRHVDIRGIKESAPELGRDPITPAQARKWASSEPGDDCPAVPIERAPRRLDSISDAAFIAALDIPPAPTSNCDAPAVSSDGGGSCSGGE